jgi:Tol biopolymer transport system component
VGKSQTNISPDRTDVVYAAATGLLHTVPATGKPTDDQLFFSGNGHVDADCGSLKRPAWSSQSFIAPCARCPEVGRCGVADSVAVYELMIKTGKVAKLVTDARRPTVSPGGRYVAYQLGDGLFLADLEHRDAAPQSLSPTNTTEADSEPAWSPDGKLAFRRELPNGGAIFTMEVLRGNDEEVVPEAERTASPLYVGDMDAFNPSWSPTGDKLVFRLAKEKASDLVVMDAAGGEPTPLFKHSPGTAIETNWFPTWRTW